MDWYLSSQLEKEASAKQSLAMALLMWMSGVLTFEAAQATAADNNVSPQTFQAVVHNLDIRAMKGMTNDQKKAYIDKALGRTPPARTQEKKTYPVMPVYHAKPNSPNMESKPEAKPSNEFSSSISVDDIVQKMLEQEGVLSSPGKTPLMIGGKWRASALRDGIVYGRFEVDKEKTSKSKFLYMKNPEDVPKIVRFLIETRYPGNFGLPKVPTLRQIVVKFDQSNSAGKIQYLKQHLPGIDLDKPLSYYK
jgi:hypothetical protein